MTYQPKGKRPCPRCGSTTYARSRWVDGQLVACSLCRDWAQLSAAANKDLRRS